MVSTNWSLPCVRAGDPPPYMHSSGSIARASHKPARRRVSAQPVPCLSLSGGGVERAGVAVGGGQEQVVEPTQPGVGTSQGTAGSLPSAAGGAPALSCRWGPCLPKGKQADGDGAAPLQGPTPSGGEDRPLLAQL